ncbi:NAD(P)-dependent oxidoreductase [Paraconexibacter sp.]|uniref:NAD(P)-dependent oxidoreductase n=1 Tax=Paraconexibacter sp. TaxID=2949640 RepID=UPI0035659128
MDIGFLGLGIMGSRMAANLARAGHTLTVHNRTRATAEAWVAEHGGTVADTPAQAAAAADVVISMVVDGAQVEQILLGPDGAVHGARDGALFVDMSTVSPADTRRIGAALGERGVAFVDAPVTGSSPKAQDGTLTIMAGGAATDVQRVWPLLQIMGELVLHVGELGQGEMVKLINNATAAANALAVAQALTVGRATGVDLDALVQVMEAGSGGSTMLSLKATPMMRHDYTTLFKLEHMLKDVRLCLEQAEQAGVAYPAAAAACDALLACAERGLGDADFGAVVEAVETSQGIRL